MLAGWEGPTCVCEETRQDRERNEGVRVRCSELLERWATYNGCHRDGRYADDWSEGREEF
jgi:hypothetical protein